jgi:hypothetical protein
MSSMDSTLQLLLSFQLKTKCEIALFVGKLSKSQLSTLQKILSQTTSEQTPIDAEEKKKARIDKIKNLLDKKGPSAKESATGIIKNILGRYLLQYIAINILQYILQL